MDLAPPRGTRDFYPEDMWLRNWLFGHFREVARLHAFEEYDTPMIENEALYTRKGGEEIVQQLYAFEDKSGRRLALRGEMTPSLARLVLQKGRSLPLPIRWFSIPQCWRYERMTRGRRREHYQLNMDIFGVAEVTAEAELLGAVVALFTRLGLGPEEVVIKVSNRKLLQGTLEKIGIPDDRFEAICVLVDKLEKVPVEAVREEMEALGVVSDQIDQIVGTLSLTSLDEAASIMGAEQAGIRELRQLFDLSASYGFADWLGFDAGLVRGLAYYTGTVFEAFARDVNLRAICGGGRYDRLLSTLGGVDVPGCGFGFGDAVIVELLRDKQLLPIPSRSIDDVVFAFEPGLRAAAMELTARLRGRGRSVDLILEDRKLKWALKHADGMGADRLVLLAPDEWAAGKVRVRDLATGHEQDVAADSL